MGLDITICNYNKGKEASTHWSYSTIHILRDYARKMVNASDEDSDEAREHFPNLIWHSDAEGYYVGYLPNEWDKKTQLWVGSVEGLYAELQKVSIHMMQNGYEGEAKQVLVELLKLFAETNYDPEEDTRYMLVVFS